VSLYQPGFHALVGYTGAISFLTGRNEIAPIIKRSLLMLNTNPSPRTKAISILSDFRQEWQEAANGKSLLEVEGNIGMVLADLVNSFELASHEQSLVLGPQLFDEMRDILYQPSRN